MNNPSGWEFVRRSRTNIDQHDAWLEQARAMADRPSAIEAGLSIDAAYHAISILALRHENSPLAGKLLPEDEPTSDINATAFFRTATAIDTVLTHGDSTQATSAATFAAELAEALPLSKYPGQKQSILANALGIELPSDVSVAQQLVEQRLLPQGAPEEQIALTGLISSNARSWQNGI